MGERWKRAAAGTSKSKSERAGGGLGTASQKKEGADGNHCHPRPVFHASGIIRHDLIDLVPGTERPHGIRSHHIRVALEVLTDTQDAFPERHVGDLGLFETPCAVLFGGHIDGAGLGAEGHAPITEEVLALPGAMTAAIDDATLDVNAEAILALVLDAMVVRKNGRDLPSPVAGA